MTASCFLSHSTTLRKDSVEPVASPTSHSIISRISSVTKSPTASASTRSSSKKISFGTLFTRCYRRHSLTTDREPKLAISDQIIFLSTRTDKLKWPVLTHGLGNRQTTPRLSTKRRLRISRQKKSRTISLEKWRKALTSNWPKHSQSDWPASMQPHCLNQNHFIAKTLSSATRS